MIDISLNFGTIVVITFSMTICFYLFFFMFGVGGIAKNRDAQGLDEKSKTDI